MSSRLTRSDNVITLRDAYGQLIQSNSSTCKALAHEFSQNFSPPSMIAVNIDPTENSMFQVDLSLSTVRSVIHDLSNSAAGPDRIPATIYKRFISNLAPPLLSIFQQSIIQRRVPSPWKIATVIVLYKGKGDKLSACSYRPISLTNVACKILERIMVRSLTTYLEIGNCRLDGSQHGFRQGKSTVTNLLECDACIADFQVI